MCGSEPPLLLTRRTLDSFCAAWPGTCNRNSLRRYAQRRRLDKDGRTPLPENTVYESCSSSVTRVLELMGMVGYTSIAVIGIDLNSSEHFYTSRFAHMSFESVARKFSQRVMKSALGNSSAHATAVRGVPYFFEHYSRVVVPITNLAPQSLLASSDGIQTVPLDFVTSGSWTPGSTWSEYLVTVRKAHGMPPWLSPSQPPKLHKAQTKAHTKSVKAQRKLRERSLAQIVSEQAHAQRDHAAGLRGIATGALVGLAATAVGLTYCCVCTSSASISPGAYTRVREVM